jgi:preprotein translocase subunit SecE
MARRMVQGGKPAKGKAPILKRFTGYFKNVRAELKAVDWPTKTQVQSYATVVFATLVVVIGLIFLFNVVFAKAVSLLFG